MPGFINNSHDRNNLNFLLCLDNHSLKQWYKVCSDDDLLYAKKLLDAYSLEIEEETKKKFNHSNVESKQHTE